jgi:hypothetical protein
MTIRLSALRAGRPLPSGKFLVLISVGGWVDPRTIVRLVVLHNLKIPMTSSGIEPSTFWITMKKHNVSETGSVYVLRCGKTPTLLGPIERANLNQSSSEDGNRSSFRNVVFFHCYVGKIRTMDKVRKPNISVCYTPSSESYSIYIDLLVCSIVPQPTTLPRALNIMK